jgi:hypothetical protein
MGVILVRVARHANRLVTRTDTVAVVGAESDVGTLFYCSQTCQHLECYEAECLGILFLLGLPFVCI